MMKSGALGCPYYAVENGQTIWCDEDPVTPHHGEKVIEHDGPVKHGPPVQIRKKAS